MAAQSEATSRRRARLAEALTDAAERTIARDGIDALKARALAEEVGCALGAIYTVFPDLDALVLAVQSRTLKRIDAALAAVETGGPPGGPEAMRRLVALGHAYLGFAVENPRLWRALFEYRLKGGAEVPDWFMRQLVALFDHLAAPLAALFPVRPAAERAEIAQTLFAAVHGIVSLGLDGKLGNVGQSVVRERITFLVKHVGEASARVPPPLAGEGQPREARQGEGP